MHTRGDRFQSISPPHNTAPLVNVSFSVAIDLCRAKGVARSITVPVDNFTMRGDPSLQGKHLGWAPDVRCTKLAEESPHLSCVVYGDALIN